MSLFLPLVLASICFSIIGGVVGVVGNLSDDFARRLTGDILVLVGALLGLLLALLLVIVGG